jgi:hypothetical protein
MGGPARMPQAPVGDVGTIDSGPECPGDGIVFDPVLVLGFAEPIDAGDVEAILQDGLDTTGG